jgi:hypothetical protein
LGRVGGGGVGGRLRVAVASNRDIMSALCSCTVKDIKSILDASWMAAAMRTKVWRCEDLLGHVLKLLP